MGVGSKIAGGIVVGKCKVTYSDVGADAHVRVGKCRALYIGTILAKRKNASRLHVCNTKRRLA